MAYVSELLRLPETRGLKALFYPVLDSVASTNVNGVLRQQVYRLGAVDGASVPQGDISLTLVNGVNTTTTAKTFKDVRYIPVRFTSCSSPQSANNEIKVVLQGVVSI